MGKTTGQSGYSSRLFLPAQYCFGWLSSQLHISKHHVGILKSDLQENLSQSELKGICPQKNQLLRFFQNTTSSFPSSDSLTQYILYGDFHFYLVPGKYGFCYFGNHTLKITWKNVYRNPESDNWFFFPDQIESSSTKSMLEGRGMPKNVTGDQYQIDVTHS